MDGLTERSLLKPYLYPKSYFQIVSAEQNKTLNFELANSKPVGSLGVSYLYEPLLVSKPTPAGKQLPGFDLFNQFGLEVLSCQSLAKSQRSKESTDSVTTLQLRCVQATRLNVIQANLPLKIRPNKSKGIYLRPSIFLNGELKDKHSLILDLKTDDVVEIKTGSIEYPQI